MQKLLREPLVQFLIGGLLLFFINGLINDNDVGDAYSITVNDKVLEQYFQFQEKAFDNERVKASLAAMSPVERAELESDYIRDEILYREALALGMDDNDDVIRARLIQKMDYIILGIEGAEPAATEVELQAYFDEHAADYMLSATISFTHVFFKNKDRGQAAATALAEAALKELLSKKVSFEQAANYGERFYFYRNYIARTSEFITSHFGSDMMHIVFEDSTSLDSWQGPYDTEYGAHLVLIRERKPSRLPSLEEVAPQVLADFQRQRREQVKVQAVEKLKSKYKILH
jgi:peptidyl-prolyl cis-trans isomerase C